MSVSDDTAEVASKVKLVVAGGFASGKTTFIRAISDIEPLTTEAPLTHEATDTDRVGAGTDKQGTTVALDFGRVSLNDQLTLYLYGLPGQARFQFMWDELVRGADGGVVLVDTNRFEDCFAAVDYMERAGLPFVVAVNAFDGLLYHHPDDVREALELKPTVPVVVTDARYPVAVRDTVVAVVRHAMATLEAKRAAMRAAS